MMLTTKQVAERYGVKERTVLRWVKRDGAPFTGGKGCYNSQHRLFDAEKLDDWLKVRWWLVPESHRHALPVDPEQAKADARLHILLDQVQRLYADNETLLAENTMLVQANRQWARKCERLAGKKVAV